MVWLYILMDALILAGVAALIVFLIHLWNKHRPLFRNSISEFRNSDIYEKSVQEQKRLAHIEDSLEDVEFIDLDDTNNDALIDDQDITFSSGYGGTRELGDE